MGRVALLNPPTAAVSTELLLSLAYLASSLRAAGHEAKIIDATAPFNRMDAKDIERSIQSFEPDFIGVTLTITYIPATYEYLRKLKNLKIPIVAGGPHVNALPEEALPHGVDIVALGEGEKTIVELADYFSGKKSDPRHIAGLCFKDENGAIIRTRPRPLIDDIDEIPFPAFEDFPIKNYTGTSDVNSNPIFWAIFSSRGCPFNCTFCCGHNVFGRSYRMRSAQNIFDEIKGLVDKFGVQKIAFQDDEILLSKKRISELCNLIAENKLKIKMSLRSRIDSIDGQLLKEMKDVGFRRISFGIESWNDETLRNVKKKYTCTEIKKGIEVLERSNFPYANFNTIIGFPWEKREHFEKNLKTISEIPKPLRYFGVVVTPIPYPNTELYEAYHMKYGFTDWWLDPKMHCNEFPENQPKPLFYYFTKMMTTLYIPDPFWKYTASQKKQIERFTWKVFKMYARRHLKFPTFVTIYILSRISHLIWKISPTIEHNIFKSVSHELITAIENKVSFTRQE